MNLILKCALNKEIFNKCLNTEVGESTLNAKVESTLLDTEGITLIKGPPTLQRFPVAKRLKKAINKPFNSSSISLNITCDITPSVKTSTCYIMIPFSYFLFHQHDHKINMNHTNFLLNTSSVNSMIYSDSFRLVFYGGSFVICLVNSKIY